MSKINAGNLKKGNYILYDNDIWQVLKTDHNYRGRGSAFMKIRIKNLSSGSVLEKNYRTDHNVEIPDVTTRALQYLYKDGNSLHFMDEETCEQYELPRNIIKDQIKYLKEGQKVHIILSENKPINIRPPKSVRLKVIKAEDAIRGDTAQGAKKPVVVETGATILVPLFIKQGDTIVVNPEKGEYIERA